MQYFPSEEELTFLVKNLPVQIDGDPSEKFEVSNYKDIDRRDTNKLSNGVCLVLAEAISKKVWKQLAKWGHEMDLEQWDFLEEFLDIQKNVKAKVKSDPKKGEDETEKPKVSPDYTFIKDLVAGRPIFTHPLAHGGFRLRFGRTRISGFSAYSIPPATMFIVTEYLATGTQLKLERPGKATSCMTSDAIEGPIVKLDDDSVVYIDTIEQAKRLRPRVTEIIYLGDMLINYGDFFNRAHKLVPPGYCEEWWTLELEKAMVTAFGSLDAEKAAELTNIPLNKIKKWLEDPFFSKISAQDAMTLSQAFDIPLHPKYSHHWDAITKSQLFSLLAWWKSANHILEDGKLLKTTLPLKQSPKRALELIGCPHEVATEHVVIHKGHAEILRILLNNKNQENLPDLMGMEDVQAMVNTLSPWTLRNKSGLFIGCRMGRPEKAKLRTLTGSPQVIFPIGEEGGRLRCFQSALEVGKVEAEFPNYKCKSCNTQTVFRVCETCGDRTTKLYNCRQCGLMEDTECKEHGPCSESTRQDIDVNHYFNTATKRLGMRVYPDLIKGVRGTSNKSHSIEPIEKGILRAKHEIHVNKDGTTRYDMSQLPITHFKQKEVGTPIERLIELGYDVDIHNKPLTNPNQILELKVQDIILPDLEPPMQGANKALFNCANFIDDCLELLYKQPRFYNLKSPSDLPGHLVLCLAPHTSAGIVARIIGFSKTQAFFAHPLLHSAQRRDCDGDESCVTLILDGFINFSRKFLPAHRGSTQDAPLVLTSKLIPAEVDDMVFDMDIGWKYPLEFYEACLEYKNPWDIKINQLNDHLGKPGQYEGMGFTHPVSDINETNPCSAYKTLPSMKEKMDGQMDIARKIRAVKTDDVARLIIERHLIRDTKGNLRKFSMQQFRCVGCNEKFRRPPLIGKCPTCKGKILFTISEGSVVKYMGHSLRLAREYALSNYLSQSIDLLERRIHEVFGKDKDRQEALGKWVTA